MFDAVKIRKLGNLKKSRKSNLPSTKDKKEKGNKERRRRNKKLRGRNEKERERAVKKMKRWVKERREETKERNKKRKRRRKGGEGRERMHRGASVPKVVHFYEPWSMLLPRRKDENGKRSVCGAVRRRGSFILKADGDSLGFVLKVSVLRPDFLSPSLPLSLLFSSNSTYRCVR